LTGVGSDISPEESYGIIMFHPDTFNPIDSDFWIDRLVELVSNSTIKWYWFWPNSDYGTSIISKKLRVSREMKKLSNVKFVINLAPEAFINLAHGAQILIGNSSFGIREASYMGLPVINLGRRQHNRQVAHNVTSFQEKVSYEDLLKASTNMSGKRFKRSYLYGDGSSGLKAAKAIIEWEPRVKQD
jgi:UDP-N-acetylglucosamine 2-epimerase